MRNDYTAVLLPAHFLGNFRPLVQIRKYKWETHEIVLLIDWALAYPLAYFVTLSKSFYFSSLIL